MKDEFNDNSDLTTKEDTKEENTETNNDANMEGLGFDDKTENSSDEQTKETKENEINDADSVEMDTDSNEELVGEKPINENEEIKTDANSEANVSEGTEESEYGEGSEGGDLEEINDIKNRVSDLIGKKKYIDDAKDIANNSETGRYYTDHTDIHKKQVTDKTLETSNALKEAIEAGNFDNREMDDKTVPFTSNINNKLLACAAMSHDTGMSDHGYDLVMELGEDGKPTKTPQKDNDGNYVFKIQDPDDCSKFTPVRENHTLNSALNVLKNRSEYKEMGFNDNEINQMAVLCFSHSKSNSGIKNLNNKNDWEEGFSRINALVNKYNEDNKDNQISFDKNSLSNDETLSLLATSALALRVGDVSRDTIKDAPSQSGEKVHINKDLINSDANSYEEEVGAINCVEIGDTKDTMNNVISRKCHVGEQNITQNETEFDKENGKIVHSITVADGEFAPHCTIEAIKEHIGEFGSSGLGKYEIMIDLGNKKGKQELYNAKLQRFISESKLDERIKLRFN